MFFIAYAFNGHVHTFAGRVKVVISTIFEYFCPLGLKLIKQLIRVFECISERHIRHRVEVDEMQYRFISATEVAPDF